MLPQTILEIIKLSLELSLEVVRGIPLESRQAAWKDHEKRMENVEKLIDKVLARFAPEEKPG